MDNLESIAHIICVTIIVIFGVSGSTFSIYFYASKKPITVGRIFIIALSILDMFASAVVAPQIQLDAYYTRLWESGTIWPMETFFICLPFVIISNLFLLTSIALDRAVAVLRPYDYTQSKRRTIIVIIFAMLLSLALSVQIRITDTVFGTRGDIGKPVVAVIIIVSFVALFTSYSLIVWKLKKQKNTVKPKHQPRPILNITSENQAGETSRSTSKTRMTSEPSSYEIHSIKLAI